MNPDENLNISQNIGIQNQPLDKLMEKELNLLTRTIETLNFSIENTNQIIRKYKIEVQQFRCRLGGPGAGTLDPHLSESDVLNIQTMISQLELVIESEIQSLFSKYSEMYELMKNNGNLIVASDISNQNFTPNNSTISTSESKSTIDLISISTEPDLEHGRHPQFQSSMEMEAINIDGPPGRGSNEFQVEPNKTTSAGSGPKKTLSLGPDKKKVPEVKTKPSSRKGKSKTSASRGPVRKNDPTNCLSPIASGSPNIEIASKSDSISSGTQDPENAYSSSHVTVESQNPHNLSSLTRSPQHFSSINIASPEVQVDSIPSCSFQSESLSPNLQTSLGSSFGSVTHPFPSVLVPDSNNGIIDLTVDDDDDDDAIEVLHVNTTSKAVTEAALDIVNCLKKHRKGTKDFLGLKAKHLLDELGKKCGAAHKELSLRRKSELVSEIKEIVKGVREILGEEYDIQRIMNVYNHISGAFFSSLIQTGMI